MSQKRNGGIVMDQVRIGVIGTGRMGQSHCRVYSNLRHAKFVGICDANVEVGREMARRHEVSFFREVDALLENVDAVSVCTPTPDHFGIVKRCLEQNIHVMVEKPFTETLEQAEVLKEAVAKSAAVVQVGHIEKYNPAFIELRKVLEGMEILAMNFNRLSPFQGSNVDVDVVLDLMIHDIDLVLWLTGAMPDEIRAAGISVLSPKVDIANVRLAFASGCVANLTASRISTERVRKLRLFQPHEYISVDYARQDALRLSVNQAFQIGGGMLPVEKGEPLRLQFEGFVRSIRTGEPPCVTGEDALRTLEVALAILDKIEEHAQVVSRTLQSAG
jgi:predicted dehydrogenase